MTTVFHAVGIPTERFRSLQRIPAAWIFIESRVTAFMYLASGLIVFLHSLLGFAGLVLAAKLLSQKLTTLVGVSVAVLCGVTSVSAFIPWTAWLIATLTWVGLTLIVQSITMKSPTFATLIGKQPKVVVQAGKVLEDNLKQSQVSVTQLLSMLRQKNAFAVADVELGVIEPDGQMSVLVKNESQPLTPKTANVPVENQAGPVTVIVDGQVQPQALANLGMGRGWLAEELERKGIGHIRDVVLAQVDGMGQLTVDLKDDAGTPPITRTTSKPTVLATLKKAQADMESFCMETVNQEAKDMYGLHAQSLQEIIDKTSPYLEEHL